MTDDNSEPTKEELAQRIDQLENTVEKMLPDRRQAIKGLAVGGAGLGLGSALSGSAAGQTFSSSTGSVGTNAEPLNEVISQTGTFQSVSTDEITSSGSNVDIIGAKIVAPVDDFHQFGDPSNGTNLVARFSSGGAKVRIEFEDGQNGTGQLRMNNGSLEFVDPSGNVTPIA
jgi:hypothetical protein